MCLAELPYLPTIVPPLDALIRGETEVLRLLAAQRSPDTYIAGRVAINRDGPRFSRDIDMFHDSGHLAPSRTSAHPRAGPLIPDPVQRARDRLVPRRVEIGPPRGVHVRASSVCPRPSSA